jgi:DNA-binding cell septation regulator SpoVG
MATHGNTDAALEISDQAEYWRQLRDAPIADFAKYAGIDVDTAVVLRVAAAVDAAPPKMDISVRPIAPMGNLLGFASVKIGGITVDDFKIMESKDGELFAAAPSKPDKSSKTGYRNTVHVDKDMRQDFNNAVLSEYRAAVEQAQNRAASMRTTPDRPRMADQIAKAAREADAHNAALPAKESAAKKHEAGRE